MSGSKQGQISEYNKRKFGLPVISITLGREQTHKIFN